MSVTSELLEKDWKFKQKIEWKTKQGHRVETCMGNVELYNCRILLWPKKEHTICNLIHHLLKIKSSKSKTIHINRNIRLIIYIMKQIRFG